MVPGDKFQFNYLSNSDICIARFDFDFLILEDKIPWLPETLISSLYFWKVSEVYSIFKITENKSY